MPLNPKLCQSFFCIKSTRPWLRTASWKHGLLQHLCFGFPIRVTLVTLQTLNKTSTTKLSINFINLSWQHMATFQRFQSTTTRTYQDRTCRVCPTYSLGSQGCAAWLPATTAMKVGQTWKKTRGKQRSSKMFQLSPKDVWISGHLFLNFRRSLLHVSYDLTKKWKIHGKRRSMSPLQFSKPGTWLLWISWQHQIPCFVLLRTAKITIDPLVNMVCWKIRYLNLHVVGFFSPPLIFPFLEPFFSLRPSPVGELWWGFEIQGQSSQT